MALCESQLDSALPQLKREESSPCSEGQVSPEKKAKLEPNGDIYGLNKVPGGLPLSVDFRSPVSHFVPPAVELYAARKKPEAIRDTSNGPRSVSDGGASSALATPSKRKRGRPRIDKSSPEYIANLAARKQAKEMAAVMNSRAETGEKRKRGRPRVDKTSPEYLARKRSRELEALEKKAKREYRRRTTGDVFLFHPLAPSRSVAPTPKVPFPLSVLSSLTQSLLPHSPSFLSPRPKLRSRPVYVRVSLSVSRAVSLSPRLAGKSMARGSGSGHQLKRHSSKGHSSKGHPSKHASVTRKLQPKMASVVKIGDKKVIVRRTGKFVKRRDSAASSSTGDATQRTKRKYTKRTPSAKKNDSTPTTERAKGKRGRPRKSEQLASKQPQQAKIRVRSNLMPSSTEPITLDSDDEPDLGSPGQASDSLSLDENLRALRHIHEKYANIDKDDMYEAHLLAANFKKPPADGGGARGRVATPTSARRDDDDVLSVRSSDGASVKDLDTRVEKLEDSSDSDSSTSGSGSSSSGSSSSSSSGSSSSSDSSDTESEGGGDRPDADDQPKPVASALEDDRSFGAWSSYSAYTGSGSGSGSDGEPEPPGGGAPLAGGEAPRDDDISESENESADKSFQCHICRKWYSTRVTLKIHRRVHLSRGSGGSRSRARCSERYECDCCSETFSRRDRLTEHKAEAHRGSMTVRCEVCRKCFEDEAELAAHDENHTADERAGRCSACGATFPRYEQLRRHRACAHGDAAPRLPHACAQCGKRFGHAHSLTRHMHNHAKQLYRCVVCKASFSRADQLAQHLNSHLANYKRLKP
ncbi:unnamed protein product, partial [Iphiclides podalirius]